MAILRPAGELDTGDVEGHLDIDRTSRMVRSNNVIVNHLDMMALEEAVRIKERLGNCSITVISLNADTAMNSLRDCLSAGADEAVHIHDPAYDRRDSYASGQILAKAIALKQYDLILCGHHAADTQSGIVGAVVAECYRASHPRVPTHRPAQIAPGLPDGGPVASFAVRPGADRNGRWVSAPGSRPSG